MEAFMVYQSPYPKQRLGKPNDGGYVIASLPGTYDLCLSGGVLDDISFEEHFVTLYPTTCYAFDGTVESIPTKNVQFIQKNLAKDTTPTTTNLHEYMIGKTDVFLKIDIEGHEFRLLPAMIENGDIHKVKQLVMEIHTPADIQLAPDYYQGLDDITNETMFHMMNALKKTHSIIHFHANNAPPMQRIHEIDVPHVFELTLIRNDFIMEKIKNTETFPTKIDMKNWPHKPEYYFSGFPYT